MSCCGSRPKPTQGRSQRSGPVVQEPVDETAQTAADNQPTEPCHTVTSVPQQASKQPPEKPRAGLTPSKSAPVKEGPTDEEIRRRITLTRRFTQLRADVNDGGSL